MATNFRTGFFTLATVLLACACSAEKQSRGAGLDPGSIPPGLADRGPAISAYLEAQVKDGFSGVALINVEGDTILHEAYGSPGHGIKRDSCFWIASVTKMFTAATAVLLHERGALDLRAPITAYLDDVPVDKREITVHHLLTHTSGLDSTYVAEGVTDRARAARAILAQPLAHPIGHSYLYSGDAYNLAAIIIELVTGQPFERVVTDSILAPMQLGSIGFWGLPVDTASCEMVPHETDSPISPKLLVPHYGFRGTTGLRSNASDLLRWYQGLFNDQLIPASVRELIFTPYVEKRPTVSYGYGWNIVKTSRGTTMLAHTGQDDMITHVSFLYAFPDENVIFILLSNAPLQLSVDTMAGLREILFAQGR